MTDFDIVQLISTVGFPIVAFLLMYYQNTKTLANNTQALKELTISLRGRK